MTAAIGWIRVYRSLLDHALWLGERFTRGQAWLDLLLLASWADHVSTAGNIPVAVQRGQVLTAKTRLAARWKWNRETVSSFLAMLKRLDMIDIETSKRTDTGYTLISILNYPTFQGGDSAESSIQPGIGHDIESSIRPASDQHRAGTIKKGKEVKEGQEHNPIGHDDGFAGFWGTYPKKEAKAAALKAWRKLQPNTELQAEILRAIEAQRMWPGWVKDGGAFVPHASTWINGRRWEDQPAAPVRSRARLNEPWVGRVGGEVAL